jgi:hypothetical protein
MQTIKTNLKMKIIDNQRGITTTDFLFSMLFSVAMILLTLGLTFTLSVMEITQYLTYSAARAMAAAQENPEKQVAKAKSKFDSLKNNPAFKNLYAGNWFTLSEPEIRWGSTRRLGQKNFQDDYPGKGSDTNREIFQGVRVTLTAKVLEMNIPFVGSLAPDEGGFSARLVSMLIREPTFEECRDWMKERFNELQRKQKLKPAGGTPPAVAWEDNGC